MNEKAQTPTLELPWIAVPLVLVGGFLLWEGFSKNLPHNALHGTIILAIGIAVWFQQGWARLAGAVYFAVVAGSKLYQQLTGEFSFPQMLAVAGCACLVWALWHWRDVPRGRRKRPLVSIVLLLRQGRFLNDKSLARAAHAAWGGEFTTGEPGAEQNFVAGETPLFMIRAGGAAYLVHNQSQSYFDDHEKVISQTNELRLRTALSEHAAWIAVDLLDGGQEFAKPTQAYPKIAKLVAELSGPDCVAVLCPESGFVSVYDDTVEEKLRSPDPIGALAAGGQIPVIGVADDDPRMAAAVTQARERWPEFLVAFSQRQPGQTFAIKAPVTKAGQTEFIWLQVSQIEGENITGQLDNDPVNPDLKCGDTVTIQLKDLNDWAFTDGDKSTGFFTLKVIQEVAAEDKSAKK